MIIELKNLSRSFASDGYRIEALSNINLTIKPGDQVMIVGPSGSGKSTLMNVIGLLDKGYTGEYSLGGSDMKSMHSKEESLIRNKTFAYIFQEYALLEDESIYENVKIPLIYSKVPKSDYGVKIDSILGKVGLLDIKMKRVKFLSGGERQRVAIARALVNNPAIIIADEPTGSLDEVNRNIILDIIYDYLDETKILLFVTHDFDNNRRGNQRVMRIVDGSIVELD